MAPTSWADVPDNILVRVTAYLPCRADRVHMSCVSRQWHAAVRGEGRPPQLPPLPPLPPQLPWLIFPNTERPSFFSAIERRAHPLPLPPDVRAARFCGSSDDGWLVLALDTRHGHALYNLNSGQRIHLPPGLVSPRGTSLPLVVRAATLSSSPAPEAYMVAAIVLVARRCSAAFWCEGSESWFSSGGTMRRRPQDVIYYRGGFYFVTSDEGVVVFWPGLGGQNGDVVLMHRIEYDMQQREDYEADVEFVQGHGSMVRYLVEFVQGHGSMVRYLVESRGHLLMAVRYVYHEVGTEVFRVFRFHVTAPMVSGQAPRATWVDLDELDGRMLFVGRGCSRSFEVAQFDGFEASTVYFLDDGFVPEPTPTVDDRRWYSFTDMGRYSMEEMASEPWPPEDRRPARSDNAPPTWWLH